MIYRMPNLTIRMVNGRIIWRHSLSSFNTAMYCGQPNVLSSRYLWCVIIGQLVDDKIQPSQRFASCVRRANRHVVDPCSDAASFAIYFSSDNSVYILSQLFRKKGERKKSDEVERKQKKLVLSVPFKEANVHSVDIRSFQNVQKTQ